MAVYTPLTLAEANAHILHHYDIGELISITGIQAGIENSNFLIETAEEKFIFTLYEKRVNTDDLPFFMGAMEHLSAGGIPCPEPIHGRDGGSIYSLKGKSSCIVTFLEGKGATSIQPEHLRALGEMTARMHLASQGFTGRRENALALPGWNTLLHRMGDSAERIQQGLTQRMVDELFFLQERWPHALPSGFIHADLFPDNVFYQRNRGEIALSGIIDFYFACNDLFMYELAIILNAWCFEAGHEFNITRAGQLLRGYNSVRPLSDAELKALPVLARGAALRFLLTRAYDWLNQVPGALVRPKDPMEYVKKLRFHQQVKHHREYGL